MTRRPGFVLILAVLLPGLLQSAACASPGRPPPGTSEPLQASIPIRVVNDHGAAVLVTVEARGTRIRLGVIPAGGRETLVIPGGRIHGSGVRIRLQGEGSLSGYLSPPLTLSNDASVEVQAEPNLDRSRVSVSGRAAAGIVSSGSHLPRPGSDPSGGPPCARLPFAEPPHC